MRESAFIAAATQLPLPRAVPSEMSFLFALELLARGGHDRVIVVDDRSRVVNLVTQSMVWQCRLQSRDLTVLAMRVQVISLLSQQSDKLGKLLQKPVRCDCVQLPDFIVFALTAARDEGLHFHRCRRDSGHSACH